MKRLTYWNKVLNCWSYHCASGDAAIRLAEYENTGCTPSEIKSLCAEWRVCKKKAEWLEKVVELHKRKEQEAVDALENVCMYGDSPCRYCTEHDKCTFQDSPEYCVNFNFKR